MVKVKMTEGEIAPAKIVCIGRNYVAHIEELGNEVPEEMVVFCKPNSSIAPVLHSSHAGQQLHYETEICYMVQGGQFAAVACGLDLTKRELQSGLKKKGLPWERAKAFDGSALFSPFVPIPEGEAELTLELYVNGELRQQGTTSMMIYSPRVILQEIGSFMTLDDGDIVMTGTPAGVGEVLSGDQFKARLLAGETLLTEASWKAA
ncbi:fumarylacetoacetate hydrolase family protein [Desulfosediminicola sp.]|uniref:fumarylacetoacetate hydrolase family protein n=1 Tax=Desulfosediminicola sp. TaxID=2886825 RepID=UPI003AF24544